jgi:hypothetical protein
VILMITYERGFDQREESENRRGPKSINAAKRINLSHTAGAFLGAFP